MFHRQSARRTGPSSTHIRHFTIFFTLTKPSYFPSFVAIHLRKARSLMAPPTPRRHDEYQGYEHRHGRSNLASCAVATAFLLVLSIAGAVTLFVLFRPHDPTIQISAVQLPGFSSTNGTASFTFAQMAAVNNPNRNVLSHYDSSLVVLSRSENQVAGFMFIPAGQIDGGRTQVMSTSFAVAGFPVKGGGEVVEVESRMRLKGRVRVLRFFTHHVETIKMCTVAVSTRDGAVLGFRC